MKRATLKPVEVNDWRKLYAITDAAQLVALIRKANRVRVNVDPSAAIVGSEDHYYPRFWHGSVEVTKREALHLVQQTIGERTTAKDGEAVSMSAYTTERIDKYRRNRQTGEALPDKAVTTLWIG